MTIDETKIVAIGEWLYDGIVPCRIVIIKEDMWPGSGDSEDPPEIADDRYVPCVSVWFESPPTKGMYNAGGGYYLAVDEAIRAVTNLIGGEISWEKK